MRMLAAKAITAIEVLLSGACVTHDLAGGLRQISEPAGWSQVLLGTTSLRLAMLGIMVELLVCNNQSSRSRCWQKLGVELNLLLWILSDGLNDKVSVTKSLVPIGSELEAVSRSTCSFSWSSFSGVISSLSNETVCAPWDRFFIAVQDTPLRCSIFGRGRARSIEASDLSQIRYKQHDKRSDHNLAAPKCYLPAATTFLICEMSIGRSFLQAWRCRANYLPSYTPETLRQTFVHKIFDFIQFLQNYPLAYLQATLLG